MSRIRINRVIANVTTGNYLYVVGNSIVSAPLTTSNVSELTNLYFTNARVYSNVLTTVSSGTGISYNSSNGKFSLSVSGVTSGTYGGSNFFVPEIAIDAFGRVTYATYYISPYTLTSASEVTGGVNLRQRIVLNGGAGGYLASESNIKLAGGSGITISRVNDNELTVSSSGVSTGKAIAMSMIFGG